MNPKLTTSVMVRDFESEEAPRVLEAIARARENIVLTLSVTLGCDEWIDLMLLMELMAEINWPLTIKVEEAEWQRLQEGGLESLRAGWSENLATRIISHFPGTIIIAKHGRCPAPFQNRRLDKEIWQFLAIR